MNAHHSSRANRITRLGRCCASITLLFTLTGGPTAAGTFTGQQLAGTDEPCTAQTQGAETAAETGQLRKKVQELTGEVARLRKRVAELEKDREADVLYDKLTKEQQRAQLLQGQLLATMEKQAGLQGRRDDIDEQLRNVDSTPIYGSTAPEKVRDSNRRRLTAERQRLQSQLDLLRLDRTRLETAIADSDAAILVIRARFNETRLSTP